MHFDIVTLFPDMFDALKESITGRALEKKIISLQFWNPRDFTDDPHRRIDDRPYGGGPGMVMQYQPLHDVIQAAKAAHTDPAMVIHFSPQGKLLTQKHFQHLQKHHQCFILIASRYEGVDERVLMQDVDEEYSIGDYVVSGGELPVMMMIDAMTRLLPEALGDPESALQDSFQDDLLDHPHYTRPLVAGGMRVPEVLQSGDHQAIATWRHQESIRRTWQRRPDLLKRRTLTEQEKKFLSVLIKK